MNEYHTSSIQLVSEFNAKNGEITNKVHQGTCFPLLSRMQLTKQLLWTMFQHAPAAFPSSHKNGQCLLLVLLALSSFPVMY